MKSSRRWVVIGICGLALPAAVMAQKREDILSIQRDVAQLQDQVRQLQKSQDDQVAALKMLVQQAIEASGRTSSALATLQQNVTEQFNQQQGKLVAPMATLGTKVDQMADEFRPIRESVAGLASRLGQLDAKLTDISSAVRTLSTPPPPPAPTVATNEPPPGVSAESLYQNAFRDYSSGKDDLAMQEFTDYLKYFSDTENAPSAQYYMGQIYDRAKQYEDAAKAFDAVLERFPENPKSPDALYMKGVDLMKAGQRTEAGAEFQDFIKRYPNHDLAAKARAHLRELGLAAPRPAARKK
jgi:tol-pal system protein YbgF